MTFWQPFQPREQNAWTPHRIAHLHRRAAFGATAAEIERDRREGVSKSIDRLLGEFDAEVPLHHLTLKMSQQAVACESIRLLQAAWINEICHGADPLREQLALMWHNHFATSYAKVQSVAAMAGQLNTFRRLARAPFGDLLKAMLRDPALLIFLDAHQNGKEHPNENLARELMELFTLGVGNYGETDVKEAARALTGWRLKDHDLVFDASRHDHGCKTILGVRQQFESNSLADHLLSQPAIAARLAWRICDHFFGPDVVHAGDCEALAEQLRRSNLDIGKAIATVLRSTGFLDDETIGSRFSSPLSYVITHLRSAGVEDSAASAAVLPGEAAMWCQILGQELFNPPGVVGWPGGRTWLSPTYLIDRARFAISVASENPTLLNRLVSIEAHFD